MVDMVGMVGMVGIGASVAGHGTLDRLRVCVGLGKHLLCFLPSQTLRQCFSITNDATGKYFPTARLP